VVWKVKTMAVVRVVPQAKVVVLLLMLLMLPHTQ
jgi:hypothetical protein